MTDGYVPMPMTCHPHYEHSAQAIRELLHMSRITVPEIKPMAATYSDAPLPLRDAAIRTRTLTVKQVAGPAPYVGDPMLEHRIYYWYAAVDDLGRHVAGEVRLSEPIQRTRAGSDRR